MFVYQGPHLVCLPDTGGLAKHAALLVPSIFHLCPLNFFCWLCNKTRRWCTGLSLFFWVAPLETIMRNIP